MFPDARCRSPLTNSSNVVRIQFTFKDQVRGVKHRRTTPMRARLRGSVQLTELNPTSQANKEVVHKVTKGK